MEPAASIIGALGGPAAVAEYLKTADNTPYRWTYPRDKGGTGGVIPHWHHDDLLRMAADKGVLLTRADLAEGVAGRAAPKEAAE